MSTHKDLDDVQAEIRTWAQKNFGVGDTLRDPLDPYIGMVEELGELAHCLLKQKQGIRGTFEEHERNAQDAVGDLLIYALDFCALKNWSMQEILDRTWLKVQERDWKANFVDGQVDSSREFAEDETF